MHLNIKVLKHHIICFYLKVTAQIICVLLLNTCAEVYEMGIYRTKDKHKSLQTDCILTTSFIPPL